MRAEVQAELVDNVPFRELAERYVIENETSWSDLASRCGFTQRWDQGRYGSGDATRLVRALGIRSYSKNGKSYVQERITYDLACRLVKACHEWPVEYGL